MLCTITLGNLVALIDWNGLEADGTLDQITGLAIWPKNIVHLVGVLLNWMDMTLPQ